MSIGIYNALPPPPQVPFTLFLPEDLFFGSKERSKITVHKPIRPGDPEFKDVATLRQHCFATVTVSEANAFVVWWQQQLVGACSCVCMSFMYLLHAYDPCARLHVHITVHYSPVSIFVLSTVSVVVFSRPHRQPPPPPRHAAK